MTDDRPAATPDQGTGQAGDPTAEKPVDQWVTGDEPATGAQRSYVETLAREAGVDVPEDLSKADASRLIDDLQRRSPRVGGDDPDRDTAQQRD